MQGMKAEEYAAGFDTAVNDFTNVQDKYRDTVRQTGLAVVDAYEKSVAAAVRVLEQTSQAGTDWAAETVRTQTGLTQELGGISADAFRQLLR
ncbi:hypothetical protein ACFW1F_27120 [Streptomyces bungoensis]|uniref:hypothetical protein n=1 Tax=Streptomyces bungoensis TaxID=285568 RepID=UPI003423ADF4